jgi:hypothetical protein
MLVRGIRYSNMVKLLFFIITYIELMSVESKLAGYQTNFIEPAALCGITAKESKGLQTKCRLHKKFL